jgi:uncharacterized protein (DUF779 family)
MSESTAVARVSATEAGLQAIARMQTEHGPLMFVQSGGCCDGSLPLCFQAGELIVGDNDLLLGTVGGAAFYVDAQQDAAWGHPEFILDVAPGPPEGFSLPAGDAGHFITRSVACGDAVLSGALKVVVNRAAVVRQPETRDAVGAHAG